MRYRSATTGVYMSVFEFIGVSFMLVLGAVLMGLIAYACSHYPNGLSGLVFFGGFSVCLFVAFCTLAAEWVKERRKA